jgi:hypothetical protein
LDKLNGAIKKNLSKSWAQLYQKEFGKLTDFVTKNEPFFSLEERTKVVRLKDVRYRAVSLEIFTREYLEMTPPEQASSSSTPPNQIDEDAAYAMMIQEEESLMEPGGGGEEDTTSAWHSKTKKKSRRQRNKETAKALKKTQENVVTVTIGKKEDSAPATNSPATPQKEEMEQATTPSQTENQPAAPSSSGASPLDDSDDEILVQLLLNEFHGKFYCFNDSEVRPIFLTDLCNAFEGKSSAYLLIYRKLDMGELSVFSSSNMMTDLEHPHPPPQHQRNKYSHLLELRSYLRNLQMINKHSETTSNFDKGHHHHMEQEIITERHRLLIDPPAYWKNKIDALNLSYQTRRQEFDVMMKSLTLKVYLPEHFISDWPCLNFKNAGAVGDGNSGGSSGLRMPVVWYHGIEIECDMSKTVTEICQEIWSKMIDEAQKANKIPYLGNLLGLPSNWQTLDLTFQLSEILLCSKLSNEMSSSSSSSTPPPPPSRYFVKTPPSLETLIKDNFSHQSRVLFYCRGYHQLPPPQSPSSGSGGLGSSSIEIMETPPKELIVTYATGETSNLRSTNLISTHLYLPQTLQLHPLCQYVCSYLGIPSVQHIHIYLIQERKLSTSNTRSTVNSLSSTVGKSKEYYATSLWKSGLISRGIQQGLSFGQLEGSEIVVENLTSVKKSSPNSGLAHQEITRRNRLRTIRIDLENSGSLLQLQKDYSLGGKMFPMQMHEDDGMSVVDPAEAEIPVVVVSDDHQESVLSTQVKVFISFLSSRVTCSSTSRLISTTKPLSLNSNSKP